ncbi:hypothetical protein B9Z55_008613 [Caenorhabditis nigoni]|nr:hypothetical protein B9Z55_008613 [Caenorhabditis nigoni]
MILNKEGQQLQSSIRDYFAEKNSVFAAYEEFQLQVGENPISEDHQREATVLFQRLASLDNSIGSLSLRLTALNQARQGQSAELFETLLSIISELQGSMETIQRAINDRNGVPDLYSSVKECWDILCHVDRSMGDLTLDFSFTDIAITNLVEQFHELANCAWFRKLLSVVGQKDLGNVANYQSNINEFLQALLGMKEEIHGLLDLIE